MSRLPSFGDALRVLVVGASGGVGHALTAQLAACANVAHVIACSRDPVSARTTRDPEGKVDPRRMDVTDEASIAAAIADIARLDIVIVASGLLHIPGGLQPEKTWRSLEAASLAHTFAVNAIGPAIVAKHTLPLLPRHGRAVFAALSARVSSISDNRAGGWYGYRASKAALNQIIRTLSIELAAKRPEAICVALHPGTVDTTLSRPFQASLPDGQLFDPATAAGHLLAVIDGVRPSDSGNLIAWDGKVIAP